MALPFAKKASARCLSFWQSCLLVLPWLGISLAGCANTCFTFTSSPPTGTITVKASDPKPACTLTTAKGTIQVMIEAASTCSSCIGSNQIRHVLISLRGIAVHPDGVAADDASPDWRELLPQLSSRPLQVDLMNGAAGPPARQPLGDELAIPAGTYRQIRLRFVSNQPAPGDAVPEKKACRGEGFNCVVFEDGRVQPLLLDSTAQESRITSERIAGGALLVIPNASADLVLDFRVSWVLASADGQSVRFLPALSGTASLHPQTVE